MKREMIFYMYGFIPQDNYVEFIKSLGYKTIYDEDLLVDERVINFIKENGDYDKKYNRFSYKGAVDYRFRVGYAGVTYIMEVDTSRNWTLKPDNKGPIGYDKVVYVDIVTNKYGYTYLSINKEQNK